MNKKIKNALLLAFVILFIVITTVASLFASGYKFNLSWPLRFNRLLQKTGMLATDTQPVKATIYLNGKARKTDPWKIFGGEYVMTPAKIKNLLPGEYDLRLEAEGYWPYSQKIWINSGQTTFIEDVNLFLDNLPVLISSSPFSRLSLSPNGRYLYSSATKEIINLKTDERRPTQASSSDEGAWLDNSRLLIGGQIFNPADSEKDANYENTIGGNASNWCFDNASGLIYYQSGQTISCLKTDNQTVSAIASGDDYLDYQPWGKKLFAIIRHGNQAELAAYGPDGIKEEQTFLLPANSQYSFTDGFTDNLSLYDQENKTAYLFNPEKISASPIIIRNAKDLEAFGNDSLIYTNGWEIYTLNLKTGKSDLITRLSSEISGLLWNDRKNYLILVDNSTIKVFDFKNRSLTDLFRGDAVSSPVLDADNSYLYFWARIGNQEGLYKMRLQ
jgi:hypothetical protein